LKLITYNIQAGLGIDGVRSADRIGRLAADLGADIVGLQEVEMGSPRSLFVNQARRLAESSGMGCAFAHGFQRGPWRFGNCILSRFPIRSSERLGLPSTGESRSALSALIDTDTGPLHVICTHLGLDREERVGQVQALRRSLDEIIGPIVLMGDFNDFPDSPPILALLDGSGLVDITGPGPTFPAPSPTSRIDYIFVRGLAADGPSEVISTPFSDHLPVLARAL